MSAYQTRRTSRSASQGRPARSSRYVEPFIHGSAAPAYESASSFEVVRNPKPASGVSVLPSDIIGVARLIIVVIAVVAVIACVRVGFTAASVGTCMDSEALSAQIETARSAGSDLEVQRSYLSNTSHVRVAATQLGMGAPAASMTITLDPDVVAVDAAGNLSLSGSMAAIAAQG